MKLQPCEGCVYRVDTGREWPKGTPYYECHRRAPVVLPDEDRVPMDHRPGANGTGCGERAEAIGESAVDVQLRQSTAMERIATALEMLAGVRRPPTRPVTTWGGFVTGLPEHGNGV